MRQARWQYPEELEVNTTLWKCLNDAGQADEAVGYYTAALALRPRSPAILHSLGKALWNKKAYREARDAESKAIELKPEYRDAWLVLSMSNLRLRQPEETLSGFDTAIRLDPHFLAARLYRAEVRERLGQWQAAVEDFSVVLKRFPGNEDARRQRAYA
jgi:tetratricopeptide (TPR) repeat protein